MSNKAKVLKKYRSAWCDRIGFKFYVWRLVRGAPTVCIGSGKTAALAWADAAKTLKPTPAHTERDDG
jgi:hypothetical protein